MTDLPPLPLICRDKVWKRVFVAAFLSLMFGMMSYGFITNPSERTLLIGALLAGFGVCLLYVLKSYVLLPLIFTTIDEEGIYPHSVAKEIRRKVRWEEIERMEVVYSTVKRQKVPYVAIWLKTQDKFGALGGGGWEELVMKSLMSDGYGANLYISPWACGMKETRFLEVLTSLWRRKVPETQSQVT